MRIRLRRLVVLLIVLLVGVGGALLARGWWLQRKADLAHELLDILPQVAQRIQNFHRVKVENGRKIWEIAAREARYDEQEHVALVEDPLVALFLADGATVGLRGKEGKVSFGGRDLQGVEMSGAIQVDVSGYSMRTEVARYERASDRIVAPGAVEISGAEFDVRGDGITIEMAAQRFKLDGNVRMTLRPGA